MEIKRNLLGGRIAVDVTTLRKVHWKAPALMLGGVFAGVLFALCHHLLNTFLNGTPSSANNPRIGSIEFPTQAFNFALGTAFSFMVKASLLVAVSAAYVQAFWSFTSGTETSLAQLDALFALPTHSSAFLCFSAWKKFSSLLLLGAVAWLIPVPVILTPATLSVVVTAINPAPIRTVNVPAIDFESLKFSAAGICNDFSTENLTVCWYNGPQYAVEGVVNAVASNGCILPISPPAPNSSWTTEFRGPYLDCNDVEDPDRTAILDNIVTAWSSNASDRSWQKQLSESPVVNYLSWTPRYANETFDITNHSISNLPYDLNFAKQDPLAIDVGLLPSQSAPIGPYLMSDGQISSGATIYFATIPPHLGSLKPSKIRKPIMERSTLLQCNLLNATYRATFEYVNGEQNVSLQFPNLESANPVGAIEGFLLGADPIPHPYMLLPPIQSKHGEPNRGLLQRLSFQAVMQAFGQVFVGGIRAGLGDLNAVPFQYANTSVLSTVLVKSAELAFLDKTSQSWGHVMHHTNTDNTSWSHASLFNQAGAWSETEIHSKAPLKDVIEELFQNITISLMSSPLLQPNKDSPAPPSLVNVTFNGYHNVYHYAAAKLWLAYGISITLTSTCVLIGLLCITRSGLSFTPASSFSTIVRRTKRSGMAPDVDGESDTSGSAPLPRKLAVAIVAMAALSPTDERLDSARDFEFGVSDDESQMYEKAYVRDLKAPELVQCRSYETADWI